MSAAQGQVARGLEAGQTGVGSGAGRSPPWRVPSLVGLGAMVGKLPCCFAGHYSPPASGW